MITLKDAKNSIKSFTKIGEYKEFEMYKDIYNHFIFWKDTDIVYSYNDYIANEKNCKAIIDKICKGTLKNTKIKNCYKLCIDTEYVPIKLVEII